MIIEMQPVVIIGLKTDLQVAIHALREVGCVHVDELSESTEVSARPLSLDRDMLRLQEERIWCHLSPWESGETAIIKPR